MDNNNKTFADLFSSINNDDENTPNEKDTNKGITFDSLVNDTLSSESVFDNILNDNVLEKTSDDSLIVNTNEVTNNDTINFENLFSNANDNVNSSVLVDEEKLTEDSKEDFGSKEIVEDGTLNEQSEEVLNTFNTNLFLASDDKENNIDETRNDDTLITASSDIVNEEKIDSFDNNLFFNNSAVDKELGEKEENKVDDLNNIFFDNQNNVSELKNTVNIDNNENVNVDDSSSIFFGNSEESVDNNVNISNVEGQNDLIESVGPINQVLIESANVSKEEKVDNNIQSVSPFFQDTSEQFKKISESIFENKISFDQTKNINSKLDKIDLSNTKNFNVKLVKQKVPFLKFLTGVISYAFFIFLILILVTLLAYVLDIKIRAAKGDYSAPTFNAYVVLTGSMLPEIKVKDVVVTKKAEANDLNVGDIITFASSDTRFSGTIITHRIIKKNQDRDGNITFQTKGDNNNVADSALVQPNNIYGKVILKIPMLGYLQDFLATQGGWIIVILLPCVTVISYDVVKLAKGIKKKKNKINVIK